MFTTEQQNLKAEVTVAVAFVSVQVIDRAFQRGVITGQEAAVVGTVRDFLVKTIASVTGVNPDQPATAASTTPAPASDEGSAA